MMQQPRNYNNIMKMKEAEDMFRNYQPHDLTGKNDEKTDQQEIDNLFSSLQN